VEHSIQQESEVLDYVEYEEGTSSNAYIRAFEQVQMANGLADDLKIITIFSSQQPYRRNKGSFCHCQISGKNLKETLGLISGGPARDRIK
jgi:hypothetical protein